MTPRETGPHSSKNTNSQRPELVVPAGDLERLRMAVHYGADAVYAGYPGLNLRAYASGFTEEEFARGVDIAHAHGTKLFAAVNIFAHNHHIEKAAPIFKNLAQLNVDGLIISDPGIYEIARQMAPHIPAHLSTQAGVTNWRSAYFWQQQGFKRIVPARELTLSEIKQIKDNTDVELEVFVHGAMCMAYSGRCLLSAYFTGRGANRGECTHPCRWSYALVEEARPGDPLELVEEDGVSFILSSRDLNMIDHIPELVETGVDALKIEGRMKGLHYVATVAKVYRDALDHYFASPQDFAPDSKWQEELSKVSHRPYHTGFYFGMPEQVDPNETRHYLQPCLLAGVVLDYDSDSGMALVEQRNKFVAGESLEVLTPRGEPFTLHVRSLYDLDGNEVDAAPHPRQNLWLPVPRELKYLDLLRKYASPPSQEKS